MFRDAFVYLISYETTDATGFFLNSKRKTKVSFFGQRIPFGAFAPISPLGFNSHFSFLTDAHRHETLVPLKSNTMK